MPELFNYSKKEKISLNYYFLKFIKKIKGKYIKVKIKIIFLI